MNCNEGNIDFSQPLDHSDEEFKRLVTYTANTHGSTHNMYDLEVLDVSTCVCTLIE